MRVHHELSVPLKITSVWMTPRISTPTTCPHVADAAREQRAADHHRGDRVELETGGVQAVAREHVDGHHSPASAAQNPLNA